MKLSIALILAVFGVATITALPANKVTRATGSLAAEIADFIALVPEDKVNDIALAYFTEDPEVRAAIEYLQSDNFKALILALNDIPEYIQLLDYVQLQGWEIYYVVNTYLDTLGLDHLPVPSLSRSGTVKITGGVAGYYADLKAVLPQDELRALHQEKLQTSEVFAAFVNLLNSAGFQTHLNQLKANADYQSIVLELIRTGSHFNAAFDLFGALLGFP